VINYKLGKTPARNTVALKFAMVFNADVLPTPPKAFGHENLMADGNWHGLGNDSVSCCVFAGAAHEHMLWTMVGGQPRSRFTVKDVLSDYSAVTGYDPAKPDSDQGTDMQVAAAYRQKTGILDATGARHKIDAYAALRVGDLDELALATWLFGACGCGFQIPSSAEAQFDAGEPWDIVAGDTTVGGHYVPCLSGDTKISLLNGSEVPIKDLVGTEQWVYSLDESQNVVPALATNIRRTKEDAKVIRIFLDNGEFLDCTPDHFIMLRSGNFAEASSLVVGQSLMPLYRQLSTKKEMSGYEETMHPASQRWQYTHRIVASPKKRCAVVHHKDFNKRNNSPDNLQLMSWQEHTELHNESTDLLKRYATSEEGKAKSRETMIKNWENPEFRKRHVLHLKTNSKLREHRAKGFYNLEASRKSGLLYGPVNFSNSDRKKHIKIAQAAKIAKIASDPEYAEKIRKIAIQNLANHKVVAIEERIGRFDVYDMEVSKYHNFAVSSGIFVHNCVGRNENGNFLFITWGRVQEATPRWVGVYMDEGLSYLSLEALNSNTKLTPEGFSSDDLSRYLKGLQQ
jgi:hypothetical protein